jgi:hypothetical protein
MTTERIIGELSPRDGKEGKLKTILAVFPNMGRFRYCRHSSGARQVEVYQQGPDAGAILSRMCRDRLVERRFQALDAPLAMLAVRQMVSTDYPFLISRSEWMAAYLKRFCTGRTLACTSLYHRKAGIVT